MRENGVVVKGDQLPAFRTIEEWGAGLKWLIGFHRRWRWVLGEYLCRGDDLYHEKIWQYISPEDLGLKSRQDVSNAMYVYRACRDQYTPEIQEWTFWQSMAPLKPAERDQFITRALSGETIHRDEIRAVTKNGIGSTMPNGVPMATDGVSAQMAGLPTQKEQAKIDFSNAMLVCVKLMKYGDDKKLSWLLDELIEKAMVLKGML